MSYLPTSSIKDGQSSRNAYVSFLNALKVEETTRLCGVQFGTVYDSNFWTSGGTAGSFSVVNNTAILSSTTTANGTSTLISSRKGRFLFACPLINRSAVRIPITGTTNNIMHWGVGDAVPFSSATNAIVWEYSGSNINIIIENNRVQTKITNGSFNGPGGTGFTPDANIHAYEIIYFVMKAEFYIDQQLYHTYTPTTNQIMNGLTQNIIFSNTNINGGTTNYPLECWSTSILRIGKEEHSPMSKFISGATTNILKYGSGKIHEIIIGSTVAGTISIYDNTSATGPLLAELTTSNSSMETIDINSVFFNGLTIVLSNNGHRTTVNYE